MSKASVFDVPATSRLSLIFQMLTGMALGRVLRLPARSLLGPMFVSGVLHASGMGKLQPPGEFIIVAQVVLGTNARGEPFRGNITDCCPKGLLLSAGYVLLLLLAAIVIANILAHLYGYNPGSLLLAYAPGGVTEMSLIGPVTS